ncbi:Ribosomal lysine N-methyltransferase 2 [Psilocybe cubensis]|uniref:SET domain-containing protein n=2 Tax=Psilocybe cubensis TaxID=181762 RepID=A0A8H7Y5C1_PSICU|nr:Ribosomal lysine N-methyltransferase 2 [Psilocybe cubensis]KAH9484319.1 Ribosomal lysine N-methyltransferase 2 [Psilocybe cubensis]
MTLCPILDFANHTTKPPYTIPEPTRAELWDTGPSASRKFGDNFVLLSPSDVTGQTEELYLRYGLHSNATLFSEYGFVSHLHATEQDDDTPGGQIDLEGVIEDLFSRRGDVGSWMKDLLVEEGYWGDWTLHSSPAPAHPSYRLITALRLYDLLPTTTARIPSNVDALLQVWRDTIHGRRYIISEENELNWRETLKMICTCIVNDAVEGLSKTAAIDITDGSPEWLASSRSFITKLWQEEIDVSTSVIESVDRREEF